MPILSLPPDRLDEYSFHPSTLPSVPASTGSSRIVGGYLEYLTNTDCLLHVTDAVLFASFCGLSRSTPEGQLNPPNRSETDKRCTSIEGAVRFAKANNLLGVLLDATMIVGMRPYRDRTGQLTRRSTH